MLRLQCLWYSCSILFFSSMIISNQYHNQFFCYVSPSFFSPLVVLFFLSLSLARFLLNFFFCSYREKNKTNERTNKREESWWMSSVCVYKRVTCMSKEHRHCYFFCCCCCYCCNFFFSSYNNYRISSLMYLFACWYSLPEATFTSIQPKSTYIITTLMFKANRQRRIVASTRWPYSYSRVVFTFFYYFSQISSVHVQLFVHVMDRMLTVAIEDFKQYHLGYHDMFSNCKSSFIKGRKKDKIAYLTLIYTYIINEWNEKVLISFLRRVCMTIQ